MQRSEPSLGRNFDDVALAVAEQFLLENDIEPSLDSGVDRFRIVLVLVQQYNDGCPNELLRAQAFRYRKVRSAQLNRGDDGNANRAGYNSLASCRDR